MSQTIFIAVVDDDQSVREALVSLMQSHGYAAEAFDSAMSYLDCDVVRKTDCLIADMHMPGMSGLELHARLLAWGERVPTILITARHSEAVRTKALHDGVRCYLAKPFAEDELLRCIRSALGTSDTRSP